MELSILLAEQILSMFLTMIVGYIIVKDWIIQGDRQQDHFQYGSLHLFSLRNY